MKAYDRAVRAFLDSEPEPYPMTFQEHIHGREVERIWYAHKAREIPTDLSLIIADVVYSLRSSLDHLAFSLAEKFVGRGNVSAEQVQFPIHGGGSFFGKGVRAMAQMSQAAQDIIYSLQPFRGPKGEKASKDHPLFWLNQLSNIDKHRHFVLADAISLNPTLSLSPESRGVIAVVQSSVNAGIFEEGAEVGRILIEVIEPHPYVKVDADFHFEVAFPDGGPAEGRYVVETLGLMHNHIRDVVFPPLEPFL